VERTSAATNCPVKQTGILPVLELGHPSSYSSGLKFTAGTSYLTPIRIKTYILTN